MKSDIDYLLSSRAVRERTKKVYDHVLAGQGHFVCHLEKMDELTDFVIDVIRDNYPDLEIPYHSRWGHFKVGLPTRLEPFFQRLPEDPLERVRRCYELCIVSVLLDAGAGPSWSFKAKDGQSYSRSEGLAVASLEMYEQGIFGQGKVTVGSLRSITEQNLADGFQVSSENPLIGVSGRLALLHRLADAMTNESYFKGQRLGGLVDAICTSAQIQASDILALVLRSMGGIWPDRIQLDGEPLGDVWEYPTLGPGTDGLVPFHKLSQWLSYSLIEPLEWNGYEVLNLDELTGLAEYRNGGLFVDMGVLSLKDSRDLEKKWTPDSSLIIEWRALTVQLLDQLGDRVREKLNFDAKSFPLAKVLEGGSWHAGRRIAKKLRSDSSPPIRLDSDGTVF